MPNLKTIKRIREVCNMSESTTFIQKPVLILIDWRHFKNAFAKFYLGQPVLNGNSELIKNDENFVWKDPSRHLSVQS